MKRKKVTVVLIDDNIQNEMLIHYTCFFDYPDETVDSLREM